MLCHDRDWEGDGSVFSAVMVRERGREEDEDVIVVDVGKDEKGGESRWRFWAM